MPAAMTSGRGSDWTFRLAAIQSDNRTYRFIFAARGADPDLDRAFRSTVQSFQRLSPAEARQIRPMRLSIVTAGPSDTAASLAGRMASDGAALEQFLILNGMDRGAAVQPGQRYKIVTE